MSPLTDLASKSQLYLAVLPHFNPDDLQWWTERWLLGYDYLLRISTIKVSSVSFHCAVSCILDRWVGHELTLRRCKAKLLSLRLSRCRHNLESGTMWDLIETSEVSGSIWDILYNPPFQLSSSSCSIIPFHLSLLLLWCSITIIRLSINHSCHSSCLPWSEPLQ